MHSVTGIRTPANRCSLFAVDPSSIWRTLTLVVSMKNVSVLTDIVGNHTRGEEEVGVDHPAIGDGLKRGTRLSSWNWGINIS